MTLHLSKHLEELIEQRAAQSGCASAREYVEKLILEDEGRQLRARADEAGPPIDEYIDSLPPEKQARAREILEQMLLDGLNSGEPILADDAYWEKKKAALIERHKSQRQST